MVDMLINHIEQNMHGSNPHAKPNAHQKEVNKVDEKEEVQSKHNRINNLQVVTISDGKLYPRKSSRGTRMVVLLCHAIAIITSAQHLKMPTKTLMSILNQPIIKE